MERGGEIDSYAFAMDTPTGIPSELTYIQQLLVRTTKFKEWFGDWEKSAQKILELNYHEQIINSYYVLNDALSDSIDTTKYPIDNIFPDFVYFLDKDIQVFYKGVSKLINYKTLEPRVVFHGTRSEKEFYTFDTKGTRPYSYFAYNKEYSDYFSKMGDGLTYEVFLNVKKPFWNIDFMRKLTPEDVYKLIIYETSAYIKKVDGDDRPQKQIIRDLMSSKDGQDLEQYINNAYKGEGEYYFWLSMARDSKSILKNFLIKHGFDGIMYGENLIIMSDTESFLNREHFTKAITVFYPNQVKLADGRNTDFFESYEDIRYAKGGKTMKDDIMLPDTQSKYGHLKTVLEGQGYTLSPKMTKYENGGHIEHSKGKTNDAKKGGYFEGRSHSDGGIKAWNVSTNTPIEVEGGEVIITKKAVADDELKEFEGEMLTNREILSRINQDGGGVAFEQGGEIEHLNCSGKEYAYGGETMKDYDVLRSMENRYNSKIKRREELMREGHDLMKKMKEGGFI